MTSGGTSPQRIASQFNGWLTGITPPLFDAHCLILRSGVGSKSPGLIILEHELSDQSVAAFINAYPQFRLNGWIPISQARLNGTSAYANTNGSSDAVNSQDIVLGTAVSSGVMLTTLSSNPSTPPMSTTVKFASSDTTPRSWPVSSAIGTVALQVLITLASHL